MSSPAQKTIGRDPSTPLSTNVHLLNWVEKMANLTKPEAIHWVDGSLAEDEMLKVQMVESGTFIKLNEKLWPGCYYARSHPSDVARVEDRTFICSLSKDAAGPTNNWEEPFAMRRKLKDLFDGSMRGRTMYVLPFSMGPIGSPMSQIGVQLTDSPYVVVNMRIMARIGLPVYAEIDKDYKRVVPCRSRPARRMYPGLAIKKSTSSISRRRARFGLTDRVMAATPCWARNVSHCALLPTLPVMKAGWLSTC